MNVAVIGGGAAGFFAAITAKAKYPDMQVTIFEKSPTILSKVKISGGGRCNVTNASPSIDALCKAYPRGGNSLKKAFHIFNNQDVIQWFESRGVPLVVQDDDCVFPASQNAQSIIDCFLEQTRKLGVEIMTGTSVRSAKQFGEDWKLEFLNNELKSGLFKKVIVSTGGAQSKQALQWLEDSGHKIEKPVPSLFTFNMPDEVITKLMGIVVDKALVRIQGAKYSADGPLLITHWGMSGPAILKLSSLGARYLSEVKYTFNIQVNWVGQSNIDSIADRLNEIKTSHPHKKLLNVKPFSLSGRLWNFLLSRYHFSDEKAWGELGNKSINKLVAMLTQDVYAVKGRSPFRDEFVTCGGVSLKSIDIKTMQSKATKNLYFAGEVLDIDAITGGFNFQAAWTTGYIAGQLKE
jgi:predicted Rossmann fold flavoprotein